MTVQARARVAVLVAVVHCLPASPAAADWTLAAFFGGAHTLDTDLTLTRPAESTNVLLSPIHYRSESLELPPYYGYRLAWFPRSGWLGLEAELIHLKVLADTGRSVRADGTIDGASARTMLPLSSVLEEFSITHGVNLLLVNAVMRRRLDADASGNPRWILSARAGAGRSIPHPESTIDGQHVEGYEWGAMSLQAAAGTEVRLGGPLALIAEYKLTRSVQNVTVAGGRVRTPLTTHHAAIGVAVHLGPSSRTP